MKRNLIFLVLVLVLVFASCSRDIASSQQRFQTALQYIDDKTITKNIDTKNFELFTLQKVTKRCKNIKIF
jgi:hypothetical protein